MKKVLIANRGEIAVRVARTCRVMGIATAAVYSEADADALHTRVADEAVPIGPAEAARSYLDIGAILAAARRAGADAVHPGYGFLSQNGDFADAVADAGLTFIGPPGDVHRTMGDKKGARRLMAAAGVPVVPGYDGDDQTDDVLAREAARIGWPVMIKPSRGGGGKGMRVVRGEKEFLPALAGSRREARSAFGDDVVVLERFVERPRHIEVQVLADTKGHLVHLLERECSIQRRHQKVVEETPSPALTEDQRRRVCAAGVAAARAASYVNAGTVEFLLDPSGAFYFLEMNTRLQVEHPVTEAVTGLDLVRLQIEVAAGRPVSFAQDAVVARGHALECRLSAEDPWNGDLPSPGRILHCVPPDGPGVRFDGGIATGSEVSVHYDPLLAKIITWGASREESIQRMAEALRRTVVLGVVTNLDGLQAIVAHPAFRRGDLHTGFLEEHLSALERVPCPPAEGLAAAVLALSRTPGEIANGTGRPVADPLDEPRGLEARLMRLVCGDQTIDVEVGHGEGEVEPLGPGVFLFRQGDRRETFHCVRDGDTVHLFWRGRAYRLQEETERSRASHRHVGGGLEAPMPGKVIAVKVAPGDTVMKGDELLVVEAMKMENAVRAPREGRVKSVSARVGDMVSPGVVLVELE